MENKFDKPIKLPDENGDEVKPDIYNLFTYHPPKCNQIDKYEEIREFGFITANEFLRLCPDSKERDMAINKIREAVMWANAAIACNE